MNASEIDQHRNNSIKAKTGIFEISNVHWYMLGMRASVWATFFYFHVVLLIPQRKIAGAPYALCVKNSGSATVK